MYVLAIDILRAVPLSQLSTSSEKRNLGSGKRPRENCARLTSSFCRTTLGRREARSLGDRLRELQVPSRSQKRLFSMSTAAIVFRDGGIVWVIQLLFGESIKQLVLRAARRPRN